MLFEICPLLFFHIIRDTDAGANKPHALSGVHSVKDSFHRVTTGSNLMATGRNDLITRVNMQITRVNGKRLLRHRLEKNKRAVVGSCISGLVTCL